MTNTFLVVEYPGKGLPFVDWAAARPGATLDMILEPLRSVGDDLRFPCVGLVRGLDGDGLRDLPRLLDASYAPWSTLRSDARRGEWLGRFTIHVANMAGTPAARAVARHQDRYGPPWSHVDDGTVHMRLRLKPGEDPHQVATILTRELAAQGADADTQVAVQEVSPHDYGVWDELVQSAIGLR